MTLLHGIRGKTMKLQANLAAATVPVHPAAGAPALPEADKATGECAGDRRLQLLLSEHWESMTQDFGIPPLTEFGDRADTLLEDVGILFDFSASAPTIARFGTCLLSLCDHGDPTGADVADLPHDCFVRRIADHFMHARRLRLPIGFEAQHGSGARSAILYRGMALPLAEHGSVSQVFGAISWMDAPAGQDGEFLFPEAQMEAADALPAA